MQTRRRALPRIDQDIEGSWETIGVLGALWLANQVHLKPSALRSVESTLRVHVVPRWDGMPVGRVRHGDVQAWVTWLAGKAGPTTVLRAHGVLAGILDVAVRDRRILTNPARDVDLPRKVARRHTYLPREQVEALAEAAGEHKTLVLVLAYSGLRWGEAIGLRVRNLDMLRRRINVESNAVEVGSAIVEGTPKTHKVRSVPIIPSLVPLLAKACEGKGPDDLVFAGRLGAYVSVVPPTSTAGSLGRSGSPVCPPSPLTIFATRLRAWRSRPART